MHRGQFHATLLDVNDRFRSHAYPTRKMTARSVREILFSFYNRELYKISTTYDRSAIEGFTAEDLAQSISEKYGPPIDPVTEIDLSTGERQGGTAEKVVARCGNAQYSLSLNRSGLANGFTLGKGLLGFYLYQVHLHHWLESNNYSRSCLRGTIAYKSSV